MLNKEEARSLIGKVGGMTKYYAKISVTATDEETTRFANSEISQNISTSDTAVSLTLFDGKKEAVGSTNVLSGEGLEKLVRGTEAILPFVPEGEFEAFPYSQEAAAETVHDGQLAEAFGVKERAEHIKEGVSRTAAGSAAAGALALKREVIALGDNQGAFRFADIDFLSFNTVVTYGDGAAGSGQLCSHSLEGVDIQGQFSKAMATAKAARNPVSADVGAYTVVMSPLAFGDLMWYVGILHNARYIDEGISYTIGNMGKKLFGENITIRDDINFPGTQQLFFDAEGNIRKPVTLVDKGVVGSLLHDNKSAARNNAAVTGHANGTKGLGGVPFNLIVEGGSCSVEEMIAGVDRGIYINEFHYTNAINYRNLQVTGLTRNGTFLIENGKLGPAVTTMRFTQNLIDSLNSVTALSKELEKVPGFDCVYMMPAARIEGFHFTSKQ